MHAVIPFVRAEQVQPTEWVSTWICPPLMDAKDLPIAIQFFVASSGFPASSESPWQTGFLKGLQGEVASQASWCSLIARSLCHGYHIWVYKSLGLLEPGLKDLDDT